METKDLLLIGSVGLVVYLLYKKGNKKQNVGLVSKDTVIVVNPKTGLEISPSDVANPDVLNKFERENNTHQESYASVQAKNAVMKSINSDERFFKDFFSMPTRQNFS
jgi:hypothetical protein